MNQCQIRSRIVNEDEVVKRCSSILNSALGYQWMEFLGYGDAVEAFGV